MKETIQKYFQASVNNIVFWGCVSLPIGRAVRSQRTGHGFESHQVHQKTKSAFAALLVFLRNFIKRGTRRARSE